MGRGTGNDRGCKKELAESKPISDALANRFLTSIFVSRDSFSNFFALALVSAREFSLNIFDSSTAIFSFLKRSFNDAALENPCFVLNVKGKVTAIKNN